jgi:C-terminal processing protease CtpA/Prc
MRTRNLFLSAAVLAFCAVPQTDAVTLQGGVSKYDGGEGRIGVRVRWGGRVSRVQPGSPAELAGIAKGDHVLRVDGRSYRPGRIIGDPGTTVILEMKRNRERFQVAVERTDARMIHY